MDLRAVLKELAAGQVAAAYLVAGPELWIRRRVVEAIEETLQASGGAETSVLDGEEASFADAVGQLLTISLFARRRLVVLREPSCFRSKGEAEVQEGRREAPAEAERALARWLAAARRPHRPGQPGARGASGLPGVLCCVTASEPDRRLAVTRLFEHEGRFVTAQPVTNVRERTAWLSDEARRRGLRLAPGAAQELVSRGPEDLSALLLDLEKAAAYAGPGRPVDRQAIAAVVHHDREERIFAFLDAVGTGDGERALQVLRALRRQGEPLPRILVTLARHLRLIAQAGDLARQGVRPEEAARRLQQHPFAVGKAFAQARQFREDDLRQALTVILEADAAIKTGRLPEDVAGDLLVVQLAGLSRRRAAPAPRHAVKARRDAP